MRVYKYAIQVTDEPLVRMPVGAKVLSVGVQGDEVFLWAMVDAAETGTERRTFRMAGTGHEIADAAELVFVGTVHLHGGSLVFHVFERIDPFALRAGSARVEPR